MHARTHQHSGKHASVPAWPGPSCVGPLCVLVSVSPVRHLPPTASEHTIHTLTTCVLACCTCRTVDGVQYFKCKQKHGVFVQESSVKVLKKVTKKKSSSAGDEGPTAKVKKTGTKKKKTTAKPAPRRKQSTASGGAAVKIKKKKSSVGTSSASKAGARKSAQGTKTAKTKSSKVTKAKKSTGRTEPGASAVQNDVPVPAAKEPHELFRNKLDGLTLKKLKKFAAAKHVVVAEGATREDIVTATLHNAFPHLALDLISSDDDSDGGDSASTEHDQIPNNADDIVDEASVAIEHLELADHDDDGASSEDDHEVAASHDSVSSEESDDELDVRGLPIVHVELLFICIHLQLYSCRYSW